MPLKDRFFTQAPQEPPPLIARIAVLLFGVVLPLIGRSTLTGVRELPENSGALRQAAIAPTEGPLTPKAGSANERDESASTESRVEPERGQPGGKTGDAFQHALGPRELGAARPRPAAVQPVETSAATPRIAIVIDDLGYTAGGLTKEYLNFPETLNFAVLPGLAESELVCELATAHGHEVLLHVPMEPMDTIRHDPGPEALMVDLDATENARRLRAFLQQLSTYRGISNHMGSRFTSQLGPMEAALRELRAHDPNLYFLDSRTTSETTGACAAEEVGVPCVTNDLFLDSADAGEAAAQLRKLTDIALRRGEAVAIGHVRESTLGALQEALQGWHRAGIQLVAVSNLMHRPSQWRSGPGGIHAPAAPTFSTQR